MQADDHLHQCTLQFGCRILIDERCLQSLPEKGIGLKNNRVYMYLCNPVFISVEMATVDSDCLRCTSVAG